jgi:hypothetical protein
VVPVEHGEVAIRLNQDIFRIKIEKQANKAVMYADDILLLASLPSTLVSFKGTKRNEENKKETFCLSKMTTALAMLPCLGDKSPKGGVETAGMLTAAGFCFPNPRSHDLLKPASAPGF